MIAVIQFKSAFAYSADPCSQSAFRPESVGKPVPRFRSGPLSNLQDPDLSGFKSPFPLTTACFSPLYAPICTYSHLLAPACTKMKKYGMVHKRHTTATGSLTYKTP